MKYSIINTLKTKGADFVYRLSGSVLFVIAKQLIVMPFLARVYSENEYGTILTAIGIVDALAIGFGSALNNIRLISHAAYQEKNMSGNYNRLLIKALIISTPLCFILCTSFLRLSLINTMFCVLSTGMYLISNYYCTWYSEKIRHNKYMIFCLAQSLGLIAGCYVGVYFKTWSIALVVSSFLSVVISSLDSKYMKDSTKKTVYYSEISSKYKRLLFSSLVSGFMIYLDRMILYPVLGANKVALYSTASLTGKIFIMAMAPLSAVMLSYYAKGEKMTIKKLNLTIIIASAAWGAFFCVAYFISPILVNIMYPTLFESTKTLITIATFASSIGGIVYVIQPISLQYAKVKYQVYIQVTYTIVYLVFGVAFSKYYGLPGFCVAVLLSSLLRILFTYVVCNKEISLNIEST